MITHIVLEAVLRTSLAAPYADLVTRPTGRAVRASIEQALDADAGVALLDFTGVRLMDFSCADEIVAKLSRDRVRVLPGGADWMGMTHSADRESVVRRLADLHARGAYPGTLRQD